MQFVSSSRPKSWALELGGVKGSQGGSEYGRDILLKSTIMAN